MRHPAPFPVLALPALLLYASCGSEPDPGILPVGDLSPPVLVSAEPEGSRGFDLRFDEAIAPIAGSFTLEAPSGESSACEPKVRDRELRLGFPADTEPGAAYALCGEVEDGGGNSTRFALRFYGWNPHPASLRLSEIQTAKNGSATKPHRDFVEFEALSAGNLGGLELSWASAAKAYSYRFPGAEVARGDLVVLHLAPEGLPAEKDECAGDLALSGGTDAAPCARDFWSAAGGLPDASGVLVLRPRSGERPVDGLFYVEYGRSGVLSDEKLAGLVAELVAGGLWPAGGDKPSWDDGFRWKPSASRSLCRVPSGASSSAGATTCGGWYLSGSGSQSPGARNPPPGESGDRPARKPTRYP